MIPVRGATGARGCCARCWGHGVVRRTGGRIGLATALRLVAEPDTGECLAARPPWPLDRGQPGRRPGRGRLAQLHRGAMGAHPWCLRPWLRLCACSGRCAHAAGDAHPLGHGETAGRLPPGPPPAGAIAVRVTRQCRRAQGAWGAAGLHCQAAPGRQQRLKDCVRGRWCPSAVAWTLCAPAPTVTVRTVWRASVAITLTVDAASASTEPTDRSMPPMISTKVMPTASTIRSGIWLARVLKVA